MNRYLLATALCLLPLATRAQAALYTLAFDQSEYAAAPEGGTVDVQLRFQALDPDDTGTLLYTQGLVTAGGRILLAGGDATVALVGITVNPEFVTDDGAGNRLDDSVYFPPQAFPVPDARNLAGVLATDGTFSKQIGVSTTSVLVATFRFQVSGELGQTVVLGLDQLDATRGTNGFAENLSSDGVVLDDELTSDFGTATITLVPEPASVGLSLLIGGALFATRRR